MSAVMEEEIKRWTSRYHTRLVRSYGLRQEFITPCCSRQNAMVSESSAP
jgi:hypothetical protein